MSDESLVLQKRIDGIKAEYAIRTGLADESLDQRVRDGEISVDLTSIKVGNDVRLNGIKQMVQRDIAHIEAGAKLELARLEGQQKVALSTLSSGLGLERARVIGDASLKGRTAVAKQKALNRISVAQAENSSSIELAYLKKDVKTDLAELEGGFKKDLAALEGEFKVVLSEIDADSTLRMGEVRASGIRSVGKIDKYAIEGETATKIQLINTKKIVDEFYQRASDGFQASNIRVMGQLDDTNTLLSAELDASLIDLDSIATIGTMGAELGADLLNIEGEHAINLANVDGKLQRELQYITDQAEAEGANIIDLANQEARAKELMNTVRIGSVYADMSNTLTELGNDNAAKISHINNMKVIKLGNKRAEALIDYFVLDEESRIKIENANDILNAKINGANDVTDARVTHIKAREATKVANEAAVIKAENLAMENAARDQATAIDTNAVTRVGELQTMSLNDYRNALFQANLRAKATKTLADADAGQAVLDARSDVEISKEAFNIVNGYESFARGLLNTATEVAARLHTKTITNRYQNEISSDVQGSGGRSTGDWIATVNKPQLLESP